MKTQVGIPVAGAVFHRHFVALLEADPVAVEVFNRAAGHSCSVATIKENAGAPASVEVGVVFFVALNRQMFDYRTFDAIAADDRERGRRAGVSRNEIVAQHGFIRAERVAFCPYQCADYGVESARIVVRNADPVARREPGGGGNRDLFLAVVAVERERALNGIRLEENGLRPLSTDGDVVPQVQRVPHRVGSRADFHGPSAQPRDIVHGRLNGPVVTSGYIGLGMTDGDCGGTALRSHRDTSAVYG